MTPVPPRLANALLRLVLDDDDFESISGDLEEAFQLQMMPRVGVRRARLWYWRQAASVAARRVTSTVLSQPGDDPFSSNERSRMPALRQDLEYALRSLRRNPGFTAVAVLTLALGIGANVAIFSLVSAVLFKPLPFSDPQRLMSAHLLHPDREHPGIYGTIIWSYPKYEVFRMHQTVFESIALYTADQWNVTGAGAPERVLGESVEASYLETLGVAPKLGRWFTREETAAPGSAPIAVLGEGFWRRRFGGEPDVLGRTIGLNGTAHTIVGVLPSSFTGLSGQAEVWVPVTARSAAELGEAWNHSYSVIARRRPDVSAEQAEAAARLLGAQVHAQYEAPPGPRPSAPRPAWSATAVPLNDERVDPLIRRSMMLMLAAVAAVLLIVCVNLASLMLVRALSRQQEVAIRLALGASRARIVRLLMTESVLLALLGGVAGVGVAAAAIAAGGALLPDLRLVLPYRSGGLTRVGLSTLGADWRTVTFAIGLVAATAITFGLGPAWRATRRDLTTNIRASGTAAGSDARRLPLRHLLIAAEIALALVLLTASGLMLKSVARLQATELGFEPGGVLSALLTMAPGQYDNARATRLVLELLERLRANGQVQSVAFAYCAPLSGGCNMTSARFPGRPQPPNTPSPSVGVHWASPDYFSTLGIRLVQGRVFTPQDNADQPKVVVINETAARRLWPGENPIGQRIALGQGGFGDGADVIGIVADVRYANVESSVGPDVYLPLLQSGRRGGIIFVKSRATADQLVPVLRSEVKALDPDLPLVDVKMMNARFGDATWRTRTTAWLLGAFSLLALVLAGVGIYGVVSQSVAQRSRELGVRVALGASRGDIMHLVLGRALIFAAAGLVLGLVITLPAMRLLTALLYQVQPGDPAVIASLAAALLVVAAFSSYLPARRATRVSPLAVLRGD